MRLSQFLAAASLTAFGASLAQDAILPNSGALIVTPAYSYQTFDEFQMGKQTVGPLKATGTDLTQHTGVVNFEYGISPVLAADLTLGYTRTSTKFDFGSGTRSARSFTDDGLADTQLGLRYQLVDETEVNCPYSPTITARVGGILAGTYDENFPFSAGDGAHGLEASLLAHKALGSHGTGAYGGIGYRWRSAVPDDVFGHAGLYQQLGSVTANVGYRHVQGLSGLDIGGPGFDPGVSGRGFPNLREIVGLIEGGLSYTDHGGRQYSVSVSQRVTGRNTGDRFIVGVAVSFPLMTPWGR